MRYFKKTIIIIFVIMLTTIICYQKPNVKSGYDNLSVITTSQTTKTTSTTKPVTSTTKQVLQTIPTTTTTTKKVKVVSSYTDEDVELLARLINGEAGGESSECQLAVGSVVLNRVKAAEFPNTLQDVIWQTGQYACTWLDTSGFYREPSAEIYANAKYLLENGSQLPDRVLFQAQFVQGEVYKCIDGEYFCYA